MYSDGIVPEGDAPVRAEFILRRNSSKRVQTGEPSTKVRGFAPISLKTIRTVPVRSQFELGGKRSKRIVGLSGLSPARIRAILCR